MAVKYRNPLFVVVVSLVTFFIYAIYWFYKTRGELSELNKGGMSPLMATIGLFIPLVNIYVAWKYCEDVETASKGAQGKILLFVLWLVFMPAMQYITQNELNKLAGK